MLEHIKDGKPWYGEVIDDVRHPLNIENLWTADELAKIGLRVRPPTPKKELTLDQAKARAVDRIEAKAEQKRLEYITPGAGMALTYIEKRDQAEQVIRMGEEEANRMSDLEIREAYPTLAATIGVDAPTLWEVANLVMLKAHAWANKSFEIEILRANAKKKIDEAGTVEGVNGAFDAIDWDAI
jgi:hypothetical protein